MGWCFGLVGRAAEKGRRVRMIITQWIEREREKNQCNNPLTFFSLSLSAVVFSIDIIVRLYVCALDKDDSERRGTKRRL